MADQVKEELVPDYVAQARESFTEKNALIKIIESLKYVHTDLIKTETALEQFTCMFISISMSSHNFLCLSFYLWCICWPTNVSLVLVVPTRQLVSYALWLTWYVKLTISSTYTFFMMKQMHHIHMLTDCEYWKRKHLLYVVCM